MGKDFILLGTRLSQAITKFIPELNRKRLEPRMSPYEVETDCGVYRLIYQGKRKNGYYWEVYFSPLKPPCERELRWIM